MKSTIQWIAAGVLLAPMIATAQVSLAVSVGEPGFYGQLTLGAGIPQPSLVFQAPVVAVAPPVGVAMAPAPLYLHVPPGHERHWRRHCAEYNACGVPVYFVRDDWYNQVYVPHYREHREDYRGYEPERREHDRGHWEHGRGDHGDHGHHGDHD